MATLDVLLKELLTERSTAAAAAPFTVADVMARLARANLSFPEDAIEQVGLLCLRLQCSAITFLLCLENEWEQ